MKSKILISESQYKRIFLKESVDDSTDIIILPGPNAGQIQQFLKNKGFYKGIVDYDFKDGSAEAFAKYYYGSNSNIETLSQLYDKLKDDGYNVGKKIGKIFGVDMAQVISDLIKEKEKKENKESRKKFYDFGENSNLNEKDKATVWNWVRNMDKPENAKKLNISQKEGEYCQPCYSDLSNETIDKILKITDKEKEENLEFFFGPAKPANDYLPYSCIDCHRGSFGKENMTQNQIERYRNVWLTYDKDPLEVFGNVLNAPVNLAKEIYNVFDCSGIKYSSIFSEEYLDYIQCIIDNTSMIVSVVPYVGTMASGVIDALNMVIYEGRVAYHSGKAVYYNVMGNETAAKSELKKAAMNQGFATLSALGVIPGVTEARAFKRFYKTSKKLGGRADVIASEIAKQPLTTMSRETKNRVIKEIIDDGTKGLTAAEKKQVELLVSSFGNPNNIKTQQRLEKFVKKSKEFQKMYNLSKYEYAMLLNSKEFNKLLQESGGDVFKTLRHKRIQKVVQNVTLQVSLGVGASEGITAGVEAYREWSLEDDAKSGLPYAIVELEGYPWKDTRDKFFLSDKSTKDNNLLIDAWKAGWRPWPIEDRLGLPNTNKAKDPRSLTDEDYRYGFEWLMKPKNKKYRTKKMQSYLDEIEKEAIEKYDVTNTYTDEELEGIKKVEKEDEEKLKTKPIFQDRRKRVKEIKEKNKKTDKIPTLDDIYLNLNQKKI